ncbi:hypothetical protein CH340_00970 [Rhodoplanes serenus]|nr:hypothetical protein CH340_00970 [Rhodoplanes serenus]
MLRSIAVLVALAVAVPVLWLGSAIAYESWHTYTHRFRLIIEVDDHGVSKSASSVIQVTVVEKSNWVPQTGGVYRFVRGEAVFLDLGDGRNVIALLGLGPTGERDIDNLAALAFGRDRPFWQREAPSWRGRVGLPLIPTLVTFTDLNDPKSARVLRPSDFESVFGPGVRFKSAEIEMVPSGIWPFGTIGWPRLLAGEPVTRGIEAKLPWWNGPFPWLKSVGAGVYVDTRQTGLKWHKGHFKRGD